MGPSKITASLRIFEIKAVSKLIIIPPYGAAKCGVVDGCTTRSKRIRTSWRSTRSVQSRLKHLYEKLGIEQEVISSEVGPIFNSRSRAVAIALARGLLNLEGLSVAEDKLKEWRVERAN